MKDLIKHSKIHEVQQPKFKCSYCEKTFKKDASRMFHEKNHTEPNPYKCGYCEKTFRLKQWFINHENMHTGAKPFKCKLCDKSFGHSGHYYRHKKRDHPQTPKQPKRAKKDIGVFVSEGLIFKKSKKHDQNKIEILKRVEGLEGKSENSAIEKQIKMEDHIFVSNGLVSENSSTDKNIINEVKVEESKVKIEVDKIEVQYNLTTSCDLNIDIKVEEIL